MNIKTTIITILAVSMVSFVSAEGVVEGGLQGVVNEGVVEGGLRGVVNEGVVEGQVVEGQVGEEIVEGGG